jgi:TonB family protein
MNFIVEIALRATVILGLAWLATMLLRRSSADVRSRIWRTALAATALLFIPVPLPEPFRISSTALADAAAVSSGAATSIPSLLIICRVIWTIGLALLLGRLGISLAVLVRYTRSASPFHGLDVRVSSTLLTPVTWGVFRPVILVPTYALDLPESKYTAIICHERAHIDRQDWLWQILAECVTAALWFHPLVWLAAARLRSEAEHAADDHVLAEGTGASGYAQQLLEIARRLKRNSPRAAVAMTRRPRGLESRIAAILDPSRTRTDAGIRVRLTVMVTAACLLVALASCQTARIYKVAQLQTLPKVVSKVEPNYTDDARNAKIEGPVVLSLIVDAQGRPEKVQVTKSLDKGLDQQAIAAIEKWHFAPGIKDGKPVRAAAIIEVNFRLR